MDVIKALEQCNVRVYRNAKETGRRLGVGSFGSVVELKIRGEGTFAGKKLHDVLVVGGDTSRLVKECKLMSELRHPNIARFYGVCKLPASIVPALVMELMDHSLEEIIERDTDHDSSFPLETMISIFIDIANGLAYLHSRNPQVLHRDLTARNVLLDKSMNAKITDFGNSRIVDATRLSKTMTQTPGTLVYMPPEALDAHSKYSDRLDTFSFGHLALYTIIREFPKSLLPATYNSANGELVARSELERRKSYMEKLRTELPTADHPLYQLIEQCLHNNPPNRPTSTTTLHWLQEIQKLEKGEDDVIVDETYDEIKALNPDATKVERRVMTLKNIEKSVKSRPLEDGEISAQFTKTGLIEKKAAGLKGRWRAYSFTLDHRKGTLHYTKTGAFVKLDDISKVEELQSDGTRFPFKVHFVGKNPPWELNVFSEADRKDWKEALSPPFPFYMQSCRAYGQLDNKKEVVYDEVQVPPAELEVDLYTTIPNVQTEDRYKKPPKKQHTHRKSQIADNQKESNPNEYVEPNKCTPAENAHVNMPTNIASSNTEKEPKRQYTQRNSQIADNQKESNPNEHEEPNKHTPAENLLYVNLPTDIASGNTEKEPKRQYTQRKSQIADNQKESNPNEHEEPNKHTPAENLLYVNLPTDITSGNTEKVPKRQYTQRKSQIAHNWKESNPNEYEEPNKCTPAETPPYVNLPTDIANGNTDSEDPYEELVSFIKSNFSPNQMDAMVTMLQSVKYAEEGSQAENSGTVPFSVPLPDHPPPADPMVDIDIYPDVIDYSDDKEPEIYTDASTPPFPKDKPTSFCRDFKSKEGILAFGKLMKDKTMRADEKLLVTGAEETEYEHRPAWAIAKQALPTPTPLEVLHKETLYISESSLSRITKIGEGKFGEVYKALLRRRITVAVKVTKEYSSEKAMRDFQSEMSIMSEVAHSNIVRLYGIVSEGPLSPALVMEYLPFGNLLTFLREERQTDNMSLLKYMNDVAMGMHYLCERGLIHRDLAARNVLVDENKTCKVSDFGLLREVPKDNNIYVSTYQGPSPLRWMPPESIKDKIFSPASDVWSYGILQWEMFYPEKIPYDNMQDMQVIVKVAEGYRMPIPRGCPGLAAKIMRACWQHEPRKRPSFLLISNLLTQAFLPI